ncbi:MAG: DUF4157 domain-containing protein [Chitinophagales bacterium]|nr:DUF4157 domain-containing protein [Chitinophagales bacterium]
MLLIYTNGNTQSHLLSHRNSDIQFTRVTSTGRTTGHIAEITVVNKTDKDLDTEIGPFYIPSSGRYQPYIVPDPIRIYVPAGKENTIQVVGYCTDIHKPPVTSGESMPPLDTWIVPDQITEEWQPDPQNGWVNSFVSSDGKALPNPSAGIYWSIPGTYIPVGHTIDQYKFPSEIAPVLLNAINRIITTADSLQRNGGVHTPFSNNKDKEKEAVIQQTFWIYTAMLTGNEYTKDNFRENMIKQMETQSGRSFESNPVAVKEKIDEGVDDFWESFMLIGAAAKILPSVETSSLAHKDELEKHFGKDVSEVKPHTPPTNTSADSLSAKAYATGEKVTFTDKEPSKQTIAHELVHTNHQSEQQTDQNGNITNEKKDPCKCKKLTGSLSVDRGLKEDITIDIDLEKVSPEQKISYPRVNFDKSKKQNPETFTVTLKNLKLECACQESPCEMQAAERDKYDKEEEKFSIALVRYSTGVNVDGKTKVKSKNGCTYEFTSTVSSDNIELSFSVSAYCKSESCRHDFCKASIKLNFKEEKEVKEKK